jgi:threonine dehydrogenase-like Zn-dependent dehydrogenase
LLQLGAIDVTSMIAESMPLSEAPKAFERAGKSGVLKVLLTN